MWRPQNWVAPYSDDREQDRIAIYEAGADAMLKALLVKRDTYHLEPDFHIAPFMEILKKGWLVFIPEEK